MPTIHLQVDVLIRERLRLCHREVRWKTTNIVVARRWAPDGRKSFECEAHPTNGNEKQKSWLEVTNRVEWTSFIHSTRLVTHPAQADYQRASTLFALEKQVGRAMLAYRLQYGGFREELMPWPSPDQLPNNASVPGMYLERDGSKHHVSAVTGRPRLQLSFSKSALESLPRNARASHVSASCADVRLAMHTGYKQSNPTTLSSSVKRLSNNPSDLLEPDEPDLCFRGNNRLSRRLTTCLIQRSHGHLTGLFHSLSNHRPLRLQLVLTFFPIFGRPKFNVIALTKDRYFANFQLRSLKQPIWNRHAALGIDNNPVSHRKMQIVKRRVVVSWNQLWSALRHFHVRLFGISPQLAVVSHDEKHGRIVQHLGHGAAQVARHDQTMLTVQREDGSPIKQKWPLIPLLI